jgi:hypothetical protein
MWGLESCVRQSGLEKSVAGETEQRLYVLSAGWNRTA